MSSFFLSLHDLCCRCKSTCANHFVQSFWTSPTISFWSPLHIFSFVYLRQPQDDFGRRICRFSCTFESIFFPTNLFEKSTCGSRRLTKMRPATVFRKSKNGQSVVAAGRLFEKEVRGKRWKIRPAAALKKIRKSNLFPGLVLTMWCAVVRG